jgi:asparagine synthase (glutamine-hydrolysing)
MILSELTSLSTYWQHRYRYRSDHNSHSNQLLLPSLALQLNCSQKPLWMRQMQDITQFSLPTLLRYEDRNAMGHSVESRLPYMDHRLVELGLAIPEAIKLRSGYGKWAIRKIMQNKIPNRIRLARYKRGFDIPLQALLQAGLGLFIRDQIASHPAIANEFLKTPRAINQIFSDQQLLQRHHAMREAITLLWLNKINA